MSLKWSLLWFLLGLVTLIGLVWNLVVIYSAIRMKIPVSGFLEKCSYVPWLISLICLGIVLYFPLQVLVASVTGSDVVLFHREKAARRVAKALGYPVRTKEDEVANSYLLHRIKEMAREHD